MGLENIENLDNTVNCFNHKFEESLDSRIMHISNGRYFSEQLGGRIKQLVREVVLTSS